MSSPRSWSKFHLIFNGKYSPSWAGLSLAACSSKGGEGCMAGFFSPLYTLFLFFSYSSWLASFWPLGVGGMINKKIFSIQSWLFSGDFLRSFGKLLSWRPLFYRSCYLFCTFLCLLFWRRRGAWWAPVHGVAKSWTRLSDFTFTFMHWRGKWQPTPVFLPGESQGQGSPVGCHLWGRTESDTTEAT